MKTYFSLLLSCFLFSLSAQSPTKFSYQAVMRDAANELITNDTIGLEISILQNSPSGYLVYQEVHNVVSNQNGLISLEIGEGVPIFASFSAIDWSNGPYFLRSNIDPNGGSNYTLSSTTQLISVPYALHANTTDSLSGFDPSSVGSESDPVFSNSLAAGITTTDTAFWNRKQQKIIAGSGVRWVGDTLISTVSGSSRNFYLGQDTLGGIVFHLYWGADGQQHGLVVSKNEATVPWQYNGSVTGASSNWNGQANTDTVNNSPAVTWASNQGTGWFLPAIDQWRFLEQNRFYVNRALANTSHTEISRNGYYFSSTERNANEVFIIDARSGDVSTIIKTVNAKVRAVKAF
jgi:hypothetical protein